jgi:hypothetical protein
VQQALLKPLEGTNINKAAALPQAPRAEDDFGEQFIFCSFAEASVLGLDRINNQEPPEHHKPIVSNQPR